jgi:hypothetical protein
MQQYVVLAEGQQAQSTLDTAAQRLSSLLWADGL